MDLLRVSMGPKRTRSVAAADRSTGTGRTQRATTRLGRLGVTAQRVVRELRLIALADEEAQGALAVSRAVRRDRKAAREQRARRVELVVRPLAPETSRDVQGRDPELEQPALDPL